MPSEKAPIVDTQQLTRRMPSVRMQKQMSREDMRLPGERLIKVAPGMTKEGSFRMNSMTMDAVTGNSREMEDMTVTQEPSL